MLEPTNYETDYSDFSVAHCINNFKASVWQQIHLPLDLCLWHCSIPPVVPVTNDSDSPDEVAFSLFVY